MSVVRAAVASIACATSAYADVVDDLVAQGEQFAQEREYTKAIDAFKRADRERPTAATACRIGLAYTRREQWPQAELFFSRCRERATSTDPVPDWIDAAEQQLATKLAAAHVAAITIVVTPSGVPATITASAFAADETFSPRTIHLAAGVHTLEIAAPGFQIATREVTVTEEPQTVTIALEREKERDTSHPPPIPMEPKSGLRPHHVVLGGAGALALAAIAVDLFAVKPTRDKLVDATTLADYNASLGAYELRRNIDVGLAAGALVATGLGLFLWSQDRDRPTMAVTIGPHGGSIGIAWSR